MKFKDVKNKLLIGGLAALILTGLIYTTLNTRSKLLQVRSELEASRGRYSIVEKEKIRLDSLVLILKASIHTRDSVIVVKDKRINRQLSEIKLLKDSLKVSLTEVSSVTADSSYSYINSRIKPVGELDYSFDAVQVKAIHYNFIERDWLNKGFDKMDIVIGNLTESAIIRDNQIKDLKSLNNVYISQKDILKRENEVYQIEITGLNKTVRQQKLIKKITVGIAAAALTYIIVK